MNNAKGFSIIEVLVVLAIFGVVMAGLYAAYSVQLKQGVTQYRLAESEMELQIAKSIIERDIAMAGFGIADDYGGLFTPQTVSATNGTPDTLTLLGTALGTETRSSQAWSWVSSVPPTATSDYNNNNPWPDGRENLRTADRIVYLEPNTKRLLTAAAANTETDKTWLFPYPGSGTNPHPADIETGALVFGIQTDPGGIPGHAQQPYYAVRYYLGGTNPGTCESGTQSLLRAVSRDNAAPTGGDPLLNCVLDIQFAFALDTDENGLFDCWDNGGAVAATYTAETLRARLKQIRSYILVQEGSRDRDYTHKPVAIRVGDANLTACGGGGVGRDVTLTAEQLKYRWRVVALSVAPRNIR